LIPQTQAAGDGHIRRHRLDRLSGGTVAPQTPSQAHPCESDEWINQRDV